MRARRGRALALLVLLAAVSGAALWTAAWLALIGSVTARPLPDGPRAAIAGSARVGLLQLPERPQCPADEAEARVTAWEGRLEGLGWPRERVTSARIEVLAGFAAVVAPRATCLAADERLALAHYVERGGGMLLFADAGARDELGREVGLGFLTSLLGVERVERRLPSATSFVALPQASPLAAGIAGGRVEVAGPPRLLAVAPAGGPYWSDARLQPADARLPASYQAAALHAEFGSGRVAWIGFDSVAEGEHGRSRERFERLLQNALAWTAGASIASVDPWPAPYEAAVLLQVNASAELHNLPLIAGALTQASMKGTFVVPPGVLEREGALVSSLSGAGEVVVVAEDALAGGRRLLLHLQRDRLRARRASGAWPTGAAIGPAQLAPDAAGVLAGAGVDHLLASGQADSVLPSAVELAHAWGPIGRTVTLVRMARTTDDDLGLSPLGFSGLRPDWVRQRLDADFAGVAALGGLYILGVHTQGLGSPAGLATLSALARDWSRRAWVADGREIASWWRTRARLELRWAPLGADRTRLALRNAGTGPARGVGVTLRMDAASAAALQVERDGSCRLEPAAAGSGSRRLVLAEVLPGQEAACVLSTVR